MTMINDIEQLFSSWEANPTVHILNEGLEIPLELYSTLVENPEVFKQNMPEAPSFKEVDVLLLNGRTVSIWRQDSDLEVVTLVEGETITAFGFKYSTAEDYDAAKDLQVAPEWARA